jgi:hypothetical protein
MNLLDDKLRLASGPTLLHDDFRATLVEAARRYGWLGDYEEVKDFVKWCFGEAGEDAPEAYLLEPYLDDEDDSR